MLVRESVRGMQGALEKKGLRLNPNLARLRSGPAKFAAGVGTDP